MAAYDAGYGTLGGLAGTGLVSNRNDPRALLAARLLQQEETPPLPNQGAFYAAALGKVAQAFTGAKLLSDVRDDERTQAADMKAEAEQFLGGGSPSPAAAPLPASGPDGGRASTGLSTPSTPAVETVNRQASADGAGGPITPPPEFMPAYQDAARRTGIPVQMLIAKDFQESGFDPSRRGAAGERGTGQVLPSTGADPGYGLAPLSPEDAQDPKKAINWTADYLAARGRAAGVTDWSDPAQAARGLAAYNGAGPQAERYGQTVQGLTGRVQLPALPAAPASASALAPRTATSVLAPPAVTPPDPRLTSAYAARMTQEQADALQSRAETAAASANPLIRRLAPQLAGRARQAQAALDREAAAAQSRAVQMQRDRERREDRQFATGQQAQDRAARAAEARANRVPAYRDFSEDGGRVGTYVMNPDGTRGARVGDAANQHVSTVRNVQLHDFLGADGKTVETWSLNPDGSKGQLVGTSPRAAPAAAAEKPPRLPSDTVTKGILGNVSSLRQLDAAIEAVGENPGAFGMEQAVPFVSRFGPQASIDARAKVANIGSLTLHERSGAAVTASEYPRLAPFIPSASDTPETARTKLQNMRAAVLEQLQDQYDTYGPGAGYRPIPGVARALGLDEAGNPVQPSPVQPSGPEARPDSSAVASPAAKPPAPDGRTATVLAPPAVTATDLPMVAQGGRQVPDASKLRDGARYRLPNGMVARFDGARQTFLPE